MRSDLEAIEPTRGGRSVERFVLNPNDALLLVVLEAGDINLKRIRRARQQRSCEKAYFLGRIGTDDPVCLLLIVSLALVTGRSGRRPHR